VYSLEEQQVRDLDEGSFLKVMLGHPYVMVLFYNSTDATSSKLIEEYEKAAITLHYQFPGLNIWKIDGTSNPARFNMYKISGSASIRLFIRNGYTPVKYEGKNYSQDIANWFVKSIEDSISEINEISEAHEIVEKEEHIAFYLGSKNTSAYLSFVRIVAILNFPTISFATSSNPSVSQTFGVKGNSFILFRNFGEEKNISPIPFTSESLIDFIRIRKYPALMPFEFEGLERFKEEKVDAIYLFQSKRQTSEETEKIFQELSLEYRDKIGFTIVEEEQLKRVSFLQKFQIEAKDLPCVGIRQMSQKGEIYMLDRDINAKNVRIFLSNFFQNNLASIKRTQKVPSQEYDGDVRVVVTKTFEQIVYDRNNDVLLEVYSPRCIHCQNFAPTYSALGKKLRNVKGLIIAKLDATVNDTDFYKITGYPTVLLYRKENKDEPIVYKGERKVEDLINFLEKHTNAFN